MQKLYSKDKVRRQIVKKLNKNYFILKSIIKNKYIFKLIHYKIYLKLKALSGLGFIVRLSNRCIDSASKKRYNKFTLFSRFIYLKLIKNGKVTGFQKSNW
jgi:ribosomal protein S14